MPIPLALIAGLTIVPAISIAMSTALAPPLQQAFNRLAPILVPGEGVLVTLRRRELIEHDEFLSLMRRHGYSTERAENVLLSTEFFPAAGDLVNWQSKEVFEPDSIERYGLDAEFENLELDTFRKAGINPEQARNFWRAHWQHPPFEQVAEMLHRDILTDANARDDLEPGSSEWQAVRQQGNEALFDWYRLVEIPPFWRDRLTRLADRVVTRVDARRMYDMRVIDEERLLRIYLDLGYPEQDARDLTLWSRVDNMYGDLVARFGNGWITREQVLEELVAVGMPAERAETLMQTRLDNLEKPRRIAIERDLTKAEIVKGVKKEVIDIPTGVGLLVQMGYDRDEAEFVMAINIEAGESPNDKFEFDWLVQGYRQSVGLDSTPIPSTLIIAKRKAERGLTLYKQAVDGRADNQELERLDAEKNEAINSYRHLANTFGLLESIPALDGVTA